MQKSKTVAYSRTTITELMIPSYANFGGKIHGGILLSLLDKVAYACASKHAGAYVVTVSVEGVVFLQPIEVGELLSLHASVNYVGRSSMVIGIRVVSENVKTGEQNHTNTSYFTMVAKDDNGKPMEVPVLILENQDDIRRCLEAIKRKQFREQYKDEFDNEKSSMHIPENMYLLDNERVIVNK